MKLLEEIDGLVSSKIEVIKTLISIIKLETRLAGLSVYPLLLNVCLLMIVSMTLWFSCMLLLGYVALFILNNIIIAISSILFLNALLFVGLLHYMKFNLQKMSFEKTREHISTRENEHHGQEKKNNCKLSSDGKNTTMS